MEKLQATMVKYCHVKGYERGQDSSNYSQSKRSTEDAQKDAKGLQHGHGLEAVAVVPCRLIRHNGAEGQVGYTITFTKKTDFY